MQHQIACFERRGVTVIALSVDEQKASLAMIDLLDVAAWLVRGLFFSTRPEAIEAGKVLRKRLARIGELETALEASTDADRRDEVLHTLARARAGR